MGATVGDGLASVGNPGLLGSIYFGLGNARVTGNSDIGMIIMLRVT